MSRQVVSYDGRGDLGVAHPLMQVLQVVSGFFHDDFVVFLEAAFGDAFLPEFNGADKLAYAGVEAAQVVEGLRVVAPGLLVEFEEVLGLEQESLSVFGGAAETGLQVADCDQSVN